MTLAQFRIQFPEFQNAPAEWVQAYLDAAALEIDPDIWGPKADQGQGYLAAHKMALSGPKMMNSKDAVTSYEIHYKALVDQVAKGGAFAI